MAKNYFIGTLDVMVLWLLSKISYIKSSMSLILIDFFKDHLFLIYWELAPDLVTRRLANLQRYRGAYIVPGPNFIWSIDGYLKLALYGIEIYAAIDAYLRYII
jgi:hypothetical protein